MEKQRSQEWMATAKCTPNAPLSCLRQDSSSFGKTALNVWTLGQTRRNSGDPRLSGMVAATVVASWLPPSPRARALARVASVSALYSGR
jgi:hypothetical protein